MVIIFLSSILFHETQVFSHFMKYTDYYKQTQTHTQKLSPVLENG